jgi:dolichol-phosphate mannosyltransferase
MQHDYLISVIAPFHNEEAILPAFITKLNTVLQANYKNYEILLIDDGSTDHSLEIAKTLAEQNPAIKIIAFSRNYGHEIALTAGIEHASGDYVVQTDADLQHPPELIPELIAKAQEGFDIVYAARTTRNYESFFKRTASKFFYSFARKMTNFHIPDDATNFRVINKKVVQSIKRLKENNRHLLMLYAYVGFKSAAIPFDIAKRTAGESKYNYRKLINLALDSIISFSHRPLRYMSALSVLISVVLSCYAGFIVLQKLFMHGQLPDGMTSVIFITSSLFAILFLFLAVISEYIGRILVESKNRPLYYIKDHYGFDKTID